MLTILFGAIVFAILALARGLQETLKSEEPQSQSQSGPAVEQAEPQSDQPPGSQSGQSGDTQEAEEEAQKVSAEEKEWIKQHELLAEQVAEAEGYMQEANAMEAQDYYFRTTAEEGTARAQALLEEEPNPDRSKGEWRQATRQFRDMKIEVRHHGAQARSAINLKEKE